MPSPSCSGDVMALPTCPPDISDCPSRTVGERLTHIEQQLSSLTQSITSYMDKQTDIAVAFPKDPHTGEPDYDGHCSAHEQWIAESVARTEFWKKMRFELVKWGLLGFLGWLLVQVVWPALAKGHV